MSDANAALRRLPDFAALEAQQVMDTTAFQVAELARGRAPRTAGPPSHEIHLRDAIRWVRRRRSAVVGVDPRAFHWKYVEYGTIKMPAQPMFRPAAESQRGDHQRRMEQALSRAASTMAATANTPR